MHGNLLLTCNTKLGNFFFFSSQANVELTEDKHENESKHELAGNFIGFKIYNICKGSITFNKDIDRQIIKRKMLSWKEL